MGQGYRFCNYFLQFIINLSLVMTPAILGKIL